jgi:hypothetical protein
MIKSYEPGSAERVNPQSDPAGESSRTTMLLCSMRRYEEKPSMQWLLNFTNYHLQMCHISVADEEQGWSKGQHTVTDGWRLVVLNMGGCSAATAAITPKV